MAIPGAGLSLIPVDGATRTAIAQQLNCWSKQPNGTTDPRIRYFSCCKAGYYFIPPDVCDAGYGEIPFTSRGEPIVCDPDETDQHDLTILASDVEPIDPNTCLPLPQLDAPEGLAAEPGDGQVTLSWDPVEGATSYAIRYRESGEEAWIELPAFPGTGRTVTGLENGTEYEFQVQARALQGSAPSEWSGSVTATPEGDDPGPEPLPTPSGLAAGTPTETTVPLTWDAVDGADGYNVRYSLSGEDDWTETAAGADPEFEVEDLAAGTAYDFQVQATDSTGEAGDSEWSASVTATTEGEPVEPLPTPEGLAAGTPTATTVPLTWDATAGADGYVVRHSISGEDDWTETAVAGDTEVTIPSLTAETAYDFQVRATDSGGTAGPSDWSASVTATTAAPEIEAASTRSGNRRGRRASS